MNASKSLRELPTRLHHSARVIRDQESNRRLVEDVLGIPLAATWIEVVPDYQDPAKRVVMCHTFTSWVTAARWPSSSSRTKSNTSGSLPC